MNALERFMAKVKKEGGDGCWNWTAAHSTRGYGRFWDGKRYIQAHWFLLDEYPDKDHRACHKCDNTKCVRPSHIFIGTQSENLHDMVAKGRHNPEAHRKWMKDMLTWRKVNRGEENHLAKLSDFDAAVIRSMGLKRGAGAAAAKHFGLSQAGISRIRLGKSWTHIVCSDRAKQASAALLKLWGIAR